MNVGRQWHAAQPVHQHLQIRAGRRLDGTLAGGAGGHDIQRRPIRQAERAPDAHAPCRPRQGTPTNRAEARWRQHEQLDAATCRPRGIEARWRDACVVHHQQIPGSENLGKLVEAPVLELAVAGPRVAKRCVRDRPGGPGRSENH